MKNNNEPLVSVIIHSFDRFQYLLNAIRSIENQTYKNYELILINDDSNEKVYYEYNFPEFVKKIDINIKYFSLNSLLENKKSIQDKRKIIIKLLIIFFPISLFE